ncbi:MAG TPA: histidine kinase, partial [Verrucomicrobiae bacterium]
MHHSCRSGRWFGAAWLLAWLLGWAGGGGVAAAAEGWYTNVAGLRQAAGGSEGAICRFALEGTVLAVDQPRENLFFHDASGDVVLAADWNSASLAPGQLIRITGTNFVGRTAFGLSLGARPAVDADNLHSVVERYNRLHLTAGYHPLRVKWFNQVMQGSLRVEYSSAQLPRQVIPSECLWQRGTGAGETAWLPGVTYRCFEGQWDRLPDFSLLPCVKAGSTTNFDLGVETRGDNVGLEFNTYLKISREDTYTFRLSSDDGSQLYFYPDPPVVIPQAGADTIVPTAFLADAMSPDRADARWTEAEGVINSVGYQGDLSILELAAGDYTLRLNILGPVPLVPAQLRHCRVRVRGICLVQLNPENQKRTDSMVVADWQAVEVLQPATENWPTYPLMTLAALSAKVPGANELIRVRGRVAAAPESGWASLCSTDGVLAIKLLTTQVMPTGAVVECLGRLSRFAGKLSLQEALLQALPASTNPMMGRAPLTSALAVQQLPRDLAATEMPVVIHGVITWVSPDYKGLIIQDDTRAVYVWVGESSAQNLPQPGDYCELKGVTRPADFSPIVAWRSAQVLARGSLPTPLVPTRDQLLSGSLDAQYVEIRGLIAAIHDHYFTLITADGPLDLEVDKTPMSDWEPWLNAIVRIRGCLLANWNPDNHQVILDKPLHMRSAITVIEARPPNDLFMADAVHIRELTEFDARFDTFRRIKVAGQIVYAGQNTFCLMEGHNGLRFQLADNSGLTAGDEVEVVGLVELGGASPFLRQAVARKTGRAPLPPPRELSLKFLNDFYDATRVQVQGTLVDLKNHGDDELLELQIGAKTFVARLDVNAAQGRLWPIGSRLNVSGVFRALDGDRLTGRSVNSFELLLNSPDDVHILSYPPWWTLPRLLIVLAVLLVGLGLAFAWIRSLRLQVERRTRQLHREISERERAEKWRAIEQERSRIARDLHDELGSDLTEINMLAATGPNLKFGAEAASGRLQEIVEKSRAMIASLDGVVWVINSRNDKLTSLIEYLASYAEEFLGKAGIGCRVDLPGAYTDRMVPAEIRHDVLLAVREALNNAVRHGQPAEVWLQFKVAADTLHLRIQDNGRG